MNTNVGMHVMIQINVAICVMTVITVRRSFVGYIKERLKR